MDTEMHSLLVLSIQKPDGLITVCQMAASTEIRPSLGCQMHQAGPLLCHLPLCHSIFDNIAQSSGTW